MAGLFLSKGRLLGNKGALFESKRYAVSWTTIRRIKGSETPFRSDFLERIFRFADGKVSKSRRQKAREPAVIFWRGVEGRLWAQNLQKIEPENLKHTNNLSFFLQKDLTPTFEWVNLLSMNTLQ